MRDRVHDGVPGGGLGDVPGGTAGVVEVPLAADGSPHGSRRSRRDWVVDSVVFGVAGLASLATLALTALPVDGSGFRRPSEAELWLDLGVGVLAWISLWWRRRYPVTLCVVVAMASVVSAFAGGPALVLLLTVVIHRRWPWALLVAGVNVVASVLFVLWWADDSFTWVTWTVFMAFGLVLLAACLAFSSRSTRRDRLSLMTGSRRTATSMLSSWYAGRSAPRMQTHWPRPTLRRRA